MFNLIWTVLNITLLIAIIVIIVLVLYKFFKKK